jgi:hypothetical protein
MADEEDAVEIIGPFRNLTPLWKICKNGYLLLLPLEVSATSGERDVRGTTSCRRLWRHLQSRDKSVIEDWKPRVHGCRK